MSDIEEYLPSIFSSFVTEVYFFVFLSQRAFGTRSKTKTFQSLVFISITPPFSFNKMHLIYEWMSIMEIEYVIYIKYVLLI